MINDMLNIFTMGDNITTMSSFTGRIGSTDPESIAYRLSTNDHD